jgi:phospholipase C
MFVIVYDEHGGFYDHVKPPRAVKTHWVGGEFGFEFDQLGARVPAVVISPLIPRNTVDHSLYDHASIPATIERQFGVPGMGERDGRAGDLRHLITLSAPRDTPTTIDSRDHRTSHPGTLPASVKNPNEPVFAADDGGAAAVFASAAIQHLKAQPAQRAAILARLQQVKTRGELLAYLKELDVVLQPHRLAVRAQILSSAKASVK